MRRTGRDEKKLRGGQGKGKTGGEDKKSTGGEVERRTVLSKSGESCWCCEDGC